MMSVFPWNFRRTETADKTCDNSVGITKRPYGGFSEGLSRSSRPQKWPENPVCGIPDNFRCPSGYVRDSVEGEFPVLLADDRVSVDGQSVLSAEVRTNGSDECIFFPGFRRGGFSCSSGGL